MNKIYTGVIAVLILILLSQSIYLFVKISIDKKMIMKLEEENKSLITKLSSAESYIDMQNYKISEYGKNMAEAEAMYKNKLKIINEKYAALEKQYQDNITLKCDEILKIIDENQRRFINDYKN